MKGKKVKTNKEEREAKVVDAKGRTLGRVASEVAGILLGKGKVSFERHIYSGDPVRVLNASKIKITPKKLAEIKHVRYSGYPGGQKIMPGTYTVDKKGFGELLKLSIYQMLPGNKLRREMMKNLSIEE